MRDVRVVQVGLGSLGRRMVEYAVERRGVEIVGAVDPDPEKAGKLLGEICLPDPDPGIRVVPGIDEGLRDARADVALLTTVSSLDVLVPQVELIAGHGVNIISTCEELSYPWNIQPELAMKVDTAAREHGIAVLGTGVNPGFLMDYLAIVLTGACHDVRSVKVSRIQDATNRRRSFQAKIGAGLTLEEFEEKKRAGTLRHVGLGESMHMVAERMGWKLDRAEDVITPVVAGSAVDAAGMTIKKGMALGVQQIGRGYAGGKEMITLVFRASIGEKDPVDCIEIGGTPDIKSTIQGGLHGDIATCAITLNAIRSMIGLSPGLKTMAEIPAVSFFSAAPVG